MGSLNQILRIMSSLKETKASMNDILVLNVGGTKFETTRQTLLHDPTSMLAKMFDPVSPLQSGVMRDGAYFLDRDPVNFRVVLNYLRSGQLLLDKDAHLEAVKSEASFFGLAGLEEFVDNKIRETEEKANEDDKSGNEFLLNVGGCRILSKESVDNFLTKMEYFSWMKILKTLLTS